MVCRLFRPADEEGAVSVEPGVAGLNDPAACSPAGPGDLLAEFVAAAANVRHQLVVGHEFAHPWIVVAAVEAERLRSPRGRPRSPDGDRVERRG